MGESKTSDHIQIKIKIPNPSQEPPADSRGPNEDLKDMDVLCTFKIKIESQILDHGCIKNQWPYPYQDQDTKPQSGISSILQIPKWGLKGYGYSLHLQNQICGPNLTKFFNPNYTPYCRPNFWNDFVSNFDRIFYQDFGLIFRTNYWTTIFYQIRVQILNLG